MGILLVVLAALVLTTLELTNTTHIFHKKARPATVSGSTYTKGEPSQSSANSSTTSSGNTGGNSVPPSSDQKNGGDTSSSAVLTVPIGNFVSNHHPNLSGSPAPNTESSVCTTTPGASCKITFTKDGVTKSLALETTDNGGSAYWTWKLQDIGLTVGSWQVQAIALLNGQTKTASDAMSLDVSP